MRKGTGPLQWVFISLALTLIIVTVAIMQLQGAIDERMRMNARYQALEVSGIINILQASPVETAKLHSSPLCVEVVDYAVKVGDYRGELIRSPVEVEPGTISCDEDEQYEEYIVREDKIRIRTN